MGSPHPDHARARRRGLNVAERQERIQHPIGQDFAIVGVAPQHFTGTTAILGAECYMPLGVHDAIAGDVDTNRRFPIWDRRTRPLILVGRLEPGVTRDQANAQLEIIAAAHEQVYPDDNKNQDLLEPCATRSSPRNSRCRWPCWC